MGVWYATREEVKSAMDSAITARDNNRVDRAIEAASRGVEGLTRRVFYPWFGTRTFDWPAPYSRSWRLWLDEHELTAVSLLTAGGTEIAEGDYLLGEASGPPYNCVEINRSSSASFSAGQRAVSITGVFNYPTEAEPGGALAEPLDVSETAVDVTDSAAVGVGSLIRIDSERMIVKSKSLITTGQTGTLAKDNAATNLTVASGAAFTADEVIVLDAERLLVEEVAGNTLIVRRSWDGSVLASHTGAEIFARRRLTVERGALGTTAATHDTAALIAKDLAPGPVRDLCIAEALNTIQQENSGYARQIGQGEYAREHGTRGLKDLRAEVCATYGRLTRIGTV
ncbi:hypothetical protein [Umezawaea tangerina]|uniref:Uncharacterized protein n=1 Tax=Umezawaea tangerina TaxID=84725 RepID=A0A2T0SPK7_9PSEU|nr:hypothetical protein [Umezawaea tangerina]PRY35344.1 hypothetical protein CLV43_114262 [Umezawaea tangerina]